MDIAPDCMQYWMILEVLEGGRSGHLVYNSFHVGLRLREDRRLPKIATTIVVGLANQCSQIHATAACRLIPCPFLKVPDFLVLGT